MRNVFIIPLIVLFPFICPAQPEFITNVPINSSNFTNVNGALFFTSHGSLFKSDGTAEGTVLLKKGLLYPSNLRDINDTLFFVADKICSPKCRYREFWKSDGTEIGTVLIKKFYSVNILKNIGSKIFLAANDSIYGTELWVTNGTPEGTILVKDINPGNANAIVPYQHYDEINNDYTIDYDIKGTNIFFVATDDINGKKIWKSNGNETMMLNPIYIYSSAFVDNADTVTFEGPKNITNVNGMICFSTGFVEKSGTIASFLCKSDGTNEGTEVIKDLYADRGLDYFYPVGNLLYFRVDHGSPDGLWRTDGTAEGTFGLGVVSESCAACPIGVNENFFIYSGCYQGSSIGIWKTDGINAPTRAININCTFDIECSHAVKVGDYFFYVDDAYSESNCIWEFKNKGELWQSELSYGNEKIVKDIFSADDTTYAMSANLTNVNEVLYFTTREVIDDYNNLGVKRLWKYDPSPYSVTSLKNIAKANSILAYPNPATDEITIEVPEVSVYFLRMLDPYGKEVYSVKSENKKTTINLNALNTPAGLYFLKIDSFNTSGMVKILIK